jgi:GNAT superfamily N-acetyltransferase
MALELRDARPEDSPFLEQILLATANWTGEQRVTPQSIRLTPELWHYLDGWMLPSDFGVIASQDGRPVGAAWARFLPESDPGYGFVGSDIPELSIGILDGHRGAGVGGLMLDALVDSAKKRGLPGISLSVEDGNNAARRLYESRGFAAVGRVGGSDTMLLSFESGRDREFRQAILTTFDGTTGSERVSASDVVAATSWIVGVAILCLFLSFFVTLEQIVGVGFGPFHPRDAQLFSASLLITPIAGAVALFGAIVSGIVLFIRRGLPLWWAPAVSFALVVVAFVVASVLNRVAIGTQ